MENEKIYNILINNLDVLTSREVITYINELLEERKRLINIFRFVNEAFIVGGYGFDFKQAVRLLAQGGNYDEIYRNYENLLKGE